MGSKVNKIRSLSVKAWIVKKWPLPIFTKETSQYSSHKMHSSNISVGKRISIAGYVGRLTDKVKMLMEGWDQSQGQVN